jgi:hypothetical protein
MQPTEREDDAPARRGRRLAERLTKQGEGALSGLLDVLAARDRARLGSLAGTVVRAHAAGRGVDLGWA